MGSDFEWRGECETGLIDDFGEGGMKVRSLDCSKPSASDKTRDESDRTIDIKMTVIDGRIVLRAMRLRQCTHLRKCSWRISVGVTSIKKIW